MKVNFMKNFILNLSKKQILDSGLAIVLILLLLTIFYNNVIYLYIAIIALLTCMICPGVYKLFAVLWFGFSYHLGKFVSFKKVIRF